MKLKKWSNNLLLFISLILIFILASECDNTLIFFISKLASCLGLLICGNLLFKYGRI